MSDGVTSSTGTERDDLQLRWHFIKQCQQLESSAQAAEWALKRDDPVDASGHLHEMRGRLESVLEDLDECDLETEAER